MRPWVSLLDIIAYSNLFVALCAYFFTRFCFAFEICADSVAVDAYPVFVACAVFFVYALQRTVSARISKEDVSERDRWYHTHFLVMIISLISVAIVLMILYFTFFRSGFLFFAFVFLLCIIYYYGPIPLKRVVGLKSFVIGFAWALVCVIIPSVINSGFIFSSQRLLFFFQVFCFISALSVPFDIRDAQTDKKNEIFSLPVIFGVSYSKWIAMILMLLVIFVSMLCFSAGIHQISLLLSSLISIPVIFFSNPTRSRFYFSILTEGLLIFPFFMYSMLR